MPRHRALESRTRESRHGRFGGTAALDEFTVLRWITIEDPAQHHPF